MGTGYSSTYHPRPKMIFFILFVSIAFSCLGKSYDAAMVPELPEYWGEPVAPELHPIMKQFSAAVNNAHQTLVKQAAKSTGETTCDLLKTAFTMVIHARQALDCGSAAGLSSSDPLVISDHKAIVEATRSCIGSEDLCLIKELMGGTSCWGCAGKILAAAASCIDIVDIVACVENVIGAGSGCYGCICEYVHCPK